VLPHNNRVRPHIGITYSDEINPAAYVDAVRASGGEPMLIGSGDTVGVEELDGLVLAGGVDVNPALYGEDAQAETETPNHARDAMERDMVNAALQRRLPLLAICRGMQLLNVVSGGSLVQHMSGHEIRTPDKALPAHLVTIERNSGLHGTVQVEAANVNSRHHQSVNRIGGGLCIVWTAP